MFPSLTRATTNHFLKTHPKICHFPGRSVENQKSGIRFLEPFKPLFGRLIG